MIVDRYPPENLFAVVPKLLADFEPELRELDRLLDDDVLFQRVKADLARRSPQSLTRGRHSTPVEVVLRLLVVKRLYGWSYEQVEHFVGDSLVLRQFCRLYWEAVPDDTTLLRWAQLVGPQTLEQLNARVVELARSLKVTRGRKLRVDSMVVETTIHHPTDSRLLGDGVRVLSRLLRRAKEMLGEGAAVGPAAFRSRTRSIRRLAQQVHRCARRKGEAAAEEMQALYARLIGIAQQSYRQAERVRAMLQERTEAAAQRLVQRFTHFLPLVGQAIGQATRRVLQGASVPAAEKLLSLFEPHTQVIQRHKPGRAVEFGRKLWLDEVDGGLVSRYAVLDQPGQDQPYLADSLAGHQERFGHPPWLLAGDRGVYSAANERLAQEAGVKRVVLPATGKPSAERRRQERTGWWRRGFRFRAGIVGRISVLRRGFGLDRCRDHGEAGMGRWVGWGILAHNLAKVA
ncbi:MAG TPA: ISNCY family transposase, partial [Pseudonocardiaceae bacterium]|nr:ISNCY family transposase [Pseudonocardiaceae bacterium]